MPQHQLVIKNQTQELTRLSGWVRDLENELGVSAQCWFRLELILEEAVYNSITHAYNDQDEHTITITIQQHGESLLLKIIDDGLPYNPLDDPKPAQPTSLDEASPGGLGIHLIRSYVDEISYRREGSFNILTMVLQDRVDLAFCDLVT